MADHGWTHRINQTRYNRSQENSKNQDSQMTHKTLCTIRIQSFYNHTGFTNTPIEVWVWKNGRSRRFIHRMDRSMKPWRCLFLLFPSLMVLNFNNESTSIKSQSWCRLQINEINHIAKLDITRHILGFRFPLQRQNVGLFSVDSCLSLSIAISSIKQAIPKFIYTHCSSYLLV